LETSTVDKYAPKKTGVYAVILAAMSSDEEKKKA
jgi:hypothetical protein